MTWYLIRRAGQSIAVVIGVMILTFVLLHMEPGSVARSVLGLKATATFAIADSIYALSALSFLGIGPPPPFTDWGTMLTGGVDNLFNGDWWQVYPPLIVLILVVVAFRQVGDALNDIVSGQRTDAARRRRRFRLLPLSAPGPSS